MKHQQQQEQQFNSNTNNNKTEKDVSCGNNFIQKQKEN